ncbi:hypothetical protein SEUCBS139899_010409, partial [Sporothrix eucalyptigena]
MNLPDHGLVVETQDDEQTPTVSFTDIRFWQQVLKELDDKIDQVRARDVQPDFTSDDERRLEELETQPGHFFRTELIRRQKRMVTDKMTIVNVLFQLAQGGRMGQWVLHNQDLYHPDIDTKPQTRARTPIIIRDDVFTGDMAVMGISEVYAAFQLYWGGPGPRPETDDFIYWETTCKLLSDKLYEVKQGNIQPQFSPEEEMVLTSLESNPMHAFAVFAKDRINNSSPAKPKVNAPEAFDTRESPEMAEAKKQLWIAKHRVIPAMEELWGAGLPGMWVLHNDDVYLTAYDTHLREHDNDINETDKPLPDAKSDPEDGNGRRHILLDDEDLGPLCGDPRNQPRPDFNAASYWDEKRRFFKEKADDIAAGRLKEHNFTDGQMMRIELLKRDLEHHRASTDTGDEQTSVMERLTKRVNAWRENIPNDASIDIRTNRPESQDTMSPFAMSLSGTKRAASTVDESNEATD